MAKKNKSKEKLKVLAAGDFHGDPATAERLAKKAEKAKVDLIILTGDITGLVETENIIQPFKERKQKVVFVPGNWETREQAKELEKKYNIKNLENHYLKYKDIGLFGIGSADWSLYPDEERSFKHLKKEHEKIKDLEKKILVSHLHAAGTKSELSGFEGSEGIRKAIDEFHPDLFISGHIHELEGVEEKIGNTRVINVGKKGKIIRI
jgi:Icc-related predicted phosphoesterase